MPLLDAVINAKIFVTRALKFAIEVGQGSRVLNFHV
jgi:hydroxymethylpyrimidine/phosphomethylpyrimidine kinase